MWGSARVGVAFLCQLRETGGREGASFRYHAGPGGECFGSSLIVSDKVPAKFELVTRDLFLDFGEFTLTGVPEGDAVKVAVPEQPAGVA